MRDSLLLDGETGNNSYVVTTWGSVDPLDHDYLLNVLNSGPRGGLNTLTVNGSDGPDVFLLRGASIIPDQPGCRPPAFVALLHGILDAERINYDDHINSRLTVNGLGGNDLFVVDDNSAITTLDGGLGNDRFIVGQLFDIPRTPPAVHPEDQFPTIATKLGLLSDGVSFPTTIYGGAGNDTFTDQPQPRGAPDRGGHGQRQVPHQRGPPAAGEGLPHRRGCSRSTAASARAPCGSRRSTASALRLSNINGVTGEGLHVTMRNFAAKATLALFSGAVPMPTPLLLPGEDPPPVVVGAARRAGRRLRCRHRHRIERRHRREAGRTDHRHVHHPTVHRADGAGASSRCRRHSAAARRTPRSPSTAALTFADTAVLEFAAGDIGPKTVIVRLNAGVTPFPPGSIVETISHSSESDDPAYEHATIRNVYVNQAPAKVIPPPPPPVTPPTTPATPPRPAREPGTGTGGLADTGSTTPGFGGLLGGLLALLLGLGLVLVARRGRDRPLSARPAQVSSGTCLDEREGDRGRGRR